MGKRSAKYSINGKLLKRNTHKEYMELFYGQGKIRTSDKLPHQVYNLLKFQQAIRFSGQF